MCDRYKRQKMNKTRVCFFIGILCSMMILGCEVSQKEKLFTPLTPTESGILFSNTLTETDSANYFLYKSFYMGGGVAIGDVNNDGYQDVYFTGNMVENKLYLNKGEMKFEDITDKAKVAGDNRWVTGVTMADVNQDGWLDIYVSVAGIWTTKKNLLYINNGAAGGIPTFTEAAEAYGIADTGNSTQATFFDYDLDGDLDLYVANYPIVDTRTGILNYRQMMNFVRPNDSDHLYAYENGRFVDVTAQAGVLRFGLSLGVAVGDYNADGWPDLYVSNDFATPDYFFINNGNGIFSDKVEEATNHTGFYGMGIDAADINNDGLLDILQVDMSPEDNFRSKSNMASMEPDVFWTMVNNGMHYQYMKNALQLHMGYDDNGVPQFGEISQLANVALTDWSWAALIADFDNDGWKDLFVTNGSRREINNKDFFKEMNKDKQMASRYVEWVNKMPEAKVKNYAVRNFGNLKFEEIATDWGIDFEGWSNGAAYADLDNDGDLDLVVNNIDEFSIVYENNSTQKGKGNFLRLKMQGPSKNRFGFGTKATILYDGTKQYLELSPTRGFQSSIEPVLHFGVGEKKAIDTLLIRWPDGRSQILTSVKTNQTLVINYDDAMGEMNETPALKHPKFKDITKEVNLDFTHQENDFDDFKYQVLMPHKMSQCGPALAVGDVNGDGLEDVFAGGAKEQSARLFLQNKKGQFDNLVVDAFYQDREHEDVDATFFDANKDGLPDLYVVSGGNEAPPNDRFYKDRFYLNRGDGRFEKQEKAIPTIKESGSVVKAFDYDNDGDLDLFVGCRFLPRNYPKSGKSLLLRNESTKGQVKFVDVSGDVAPGLSAIGMVTDAVWADVNNDERTDLILTGEWMPVTVFINQEQGFVDQTSSYGIADETGWWSSIYAQDFDKDGDIDLIAGNLGSNYKYKATKEEPFSIYVNDYDKNNKIDIVLAYRQEGKEYPLRGRQCSSEQIPAIAIKFKDYNSFARATLEDVYSTQSIEESKHYEAVNFKTSYFENKEGNAFEASPLEKMAQVSSVNAIYADDINEDGNPDVLLAGNLYNSEVETPRNDASFGVYATGDGAGNFKAKMPYESGLMIKGEVRKIRHVVLVNGRKALLIARNNEQLKVIEIL